MDELPNPFHIGLYGAGRMEIRERGLKITEKSAADLSMPLRRRSNVKRVICREEEIPLCRRKCDQKETTETRM